MLLRWESETFLRERERTFVLSREVDDFSRAMSEKIQPVSRGFFNRLFNYTRRQGFYGFFDGRILRLRLIPRSISLLSLLSSSSVSHFDGRIDREGGKQVLTGSYRLNIFVRVFLLLFINLLLLQSVISVFFFIYNIVFVQGMQEFFVSYVLMATPLVLLLFVYGAGRFYEFTNKKERDEIFRLLKEITS
jgi:hypothetical protein